MCAQVSSKELCLCEICRCGEHTCPQQYERKLPKCLQTHEPQQTGHQEEVNNQEQNKLLELTSHNLVFSFGIHLSPPMKLSYEATLCDVHHSFFQKDYRSPDGNLSHESIYKRDYHPPEITDENPPAEIKYSNNIICEPFPMERNTTYSRSYVPCRDTSSGISETKAASGNQKKGINPLRKYYCPPHCVGTDGQKLDKNFALSHKDLMNLGLAEKPVIVKKPEEPFAKFTSYMLDYVPHKTEMKKTNRVEVATPDEKQPLSCETTHKKEFPPHSIDAARKVQSIRKKSDQTSNVPLGRDRNMATDTITMLDFKDPEVSRNSLIRRPKVDYNPPVCKMECETTTRISYPRWDNVPKTKIRQFTDTLGMPVESNVRCLFTTYQEDFSGLQAALCPAKSIERYGRKILEPRYQFSESRDEHDYYENKT